MLNCRKIYLRSEMTTYISEFIRFPEEINKYKNADFNADNKINSLDYEQLSKEKVVIVEKDGITHVFYYAPKNQAPAAAAKLDRNIRIRLGPLPLGELVSQAKSEDDLLNFLVSFQEADRYGRFDNILRNSKKEEVQNLLQNCQKKGFSKLINWLFEYSIKNGVYQWLANSFQAGPVPDFETVLKILQNRQWESPICGEVQGGIYGLLVRSAVTKEQKAKLADIFYNNTTNSDQKKEILIKHDVFINEGEDGFFSEQELEKIDQVLSSFPPEVKKLFSNLAVITCRKNTAPLGIAAAVGEDSGKIDIFQKCSGGADAIENDNRRAADFFTVSVAHEIAHIIEDNNPELKKTFDALGGPDGQEAKVVENEELSKYAQSVRSKNFRPDIYIPLEEGDIQQLFQNLEDNGYIAVPEAGKIRDESGKIVKKNGTVTKKFLELVVKDISQMKILPKFIPLRERLFAYINNRARIINPIIVFTTDDLVDFFIYNVTCKPFPVNYAFEYGFRKPLSEDFSTMVEAYFYDSDELLAEANKREKMGYPILKQKYDFLADLFKGIRYKTEASRLTIIDK